MLKKPIGKKEKGWDEGGGVVKDKGFHHPNGSPPRPVTTTHLCYPYNTDTHSYPMPPPPPPPKCTPPQTLFFTLLRCVFLPDDDDRVRRSRRAERGGNDNTAVIRRRRRLPTERAGQRFGSVHLSDVSGTEGGEGGHHNLF